MSDILIWLIVIAGVVALLVLANQRKVTVIYPPNVGLLYRDGNFVRELGPGRHSFFDFGNRTRIVQLSTARLPTQLGDFTVMTKDQFSFRLGLAPIIQVIDPRAFIESQNVVEPNRVAAFMPAAATHQALHALAANAAMEAVSAYCLREIFAAPQLVVDAVEAMLADALPGAKIAQVLITGMTLPPETRKMFTEVERSKMEGEAALERARSEQASLRALANAARLLKDNPALANLRFLQMVEQASGPKTIVMGSHLGATADPAVGG